MGYQTNCSICNKIKTYSPRASLRDYQRGIGKPCRSCRNSIQKNGPGIIFNKAGEKRCVVCLLFKEETQNFYLNKQRNKYTTECNDCRLGKLKISSRIWHLGSNYGLSVEEYDQQCEEQNHQCLICNQKVKLYVDHNHETEMNRGLICNKCNRGLGYFKDDSMILINAAKYLIASKNKTTNLLTTSGFENFKNNSGLD